MDSHILPTVTCDNSSADQGNDDMKSKCSSKVMYSWNGSIARKRGSFGSSSSEDCPDVLARSEQTPKRPRLWARIKTDDDAPTDDCHYSSISSMSSLSDNGLEEDDDDEESDSDSDDDEEIEHIVFGIEKLQECIKSYQEEREQMDVRRQKYQASILSSLPSTRCELTVKSLSEQIPSDDGSTAETIRSQSSCSSVDSMADQMSILLKQEGHQLLIASGYSIPLEA